MLCLCAVGVPTACAQEAAFDGRNVSAVVTVQGFPAPSSPVTDADRALQQRRELFNQLRTEQKTVARSIDIRSDNQRSADSVLPLVPPVPTPQQIAAGSMNVNPIQLIGSTDDSRGVVTIPNLLPPPDDFTGEIPPEIETIGAKKYANQPQVKNIQRFPTDDGNFIKRNLKKGTTKIKNAGCRLIERYDPELERFDPDDYDMPILLVAAGDEEPREQPAETGLLSRKLSDIQPTLNYAWGDWDAEELPNDFHERMDNGDYEEKFAPRTVLQWAPTNLWYHPLYFEDVGLERYGHTRKPWVQPFVSSTKFFGQVVGMPYQMVLHPPKSREFALGYYQPGEWAPKKRYQIPFNEEAAATEFLWVTGIILLIP